MPAPWEKYREQLMNAGNTPSALPNPGVPDGGLIIKGNIPLDPASGPTTFEFGEDGIRYETLIPTIVGGKKLSDDEAVDLYRKGGKFFGKFDTNDNAQKWLSAQSGPWAKYNQPQPAEPQKPAAPSLMDQIQLAFPEAQAVLRAGQGIYQGMANLPSPFALIDPEMGKGKSEVAGRVNAGIAQQNQGYEGAKERIIGNSQYPVATRALLNTRETMGGMLNPMSAVGGSIANPLARGAASASAYAASQPVTDPDANFWLEKAKQQAVAVPIGAVAGGLTAPRQAKAPTTQELKKQAGDAYKAAEAEGVVIKQSGFRTALDDIQADVNKRGFDADLHPKAAAVLKRFEAEAKNGDLTLEKAEILRRVASGALDSKEKSERNIAHAIVDRLDDFIGGLKPSDVRGGVTGDPKLIAALELPTGNSDAATASLSKARELYSRSAKASTIERLQERAKNAVGANYTTAGYETALRQQFRQLANNDAAFRRFSKDEQQAILKVVRGGPVENAMRLLGKLAVRGPVSAGPALAGGMYMNDPLVGAGIAGVGEAGRFGATQLGLRSVNQLDELIRRGSASQPAQPAVPVGNAALPLLLQSLLKPERAY